MKCFFSGLVIIILIIQTACINSRNNSQEKETTLRIMSYNVRNGMGMDEVTDLDRLSGVITQVAPDIIALQELDSVTHRSAEKNVLQEIAQRVNMHALYAPAISFDGGKYGVGILSKEKALNYSITPLPGREEARTLLIAEYPDYIFACTHLSLTEDDRTESLNIILKQAQQVEKPFILAGDLNAEPDSPFITALKEHFEILSDSTQPTFPADLPEICIDYVTILKKETVSYNLLEQTVLNAPVESDHRPVVVAIKW